MTVRLVEFPVVPLTDIPARLRLLAEQIEDGEFGEVANVGVVVEGAEEPRVMALGADGDETRAMGLLVRGILTFWQCVP